MSVMYGQVCGRKRNAEEIAAAALDYVAMTPKPVRSNHPNADVSRGELKGTVVTPKARNPVAVDKGDVKRTLSQIKSKRIQVERNEIARTPQTGAVLVTANADPEIGEYHRCWADKYVYVETLDQNRKLFDTVAEAVDYINSLDGTHELTEPWLSFLLVNRIYKYRIYTVGLVSKAFTNRALRQRDEKGVIE